MQSKKKFKLKITVGKITLILLAVFAVLLAADLILKACEEKFGWRFTVIPNLITVEHGHRNTGAAFSFLADKAWGQTVLTVGSVIMCAALIFAFLILPEKRFPVLKTAAAMVIAGAIGNIVDRIAFRAVRDFVWLNIFGGWACCNFADFYIVLGVILAIIDVLFLNEWAVLPLTKGAKERVRRYNEERAQAEQAKEAQAQAGDGGENTEAGGAAEKDDGNEN